MPDIITIGSATRDVFLLSKAFQIIQSKKFISGEGECVSLGSKIEVDDLTLTTGGGGTNAAATFASLGFSTACMTRIGDDASGKEVLEDLRAYGVETNLVKTVKKGRTGYAAVLTTGDGERSILVHRGVSAEFKSSDIVTGKLKAQWIYMSSLAGNVDLAKKIILAGKKKQIAVAYNPGSQELKLGWRILQPILQNLAFLNMNLEEAQKLTRTKSRDVKTLFKKLDLPSTLLVLTDGPNGAYARDADGNMYYARPRNIQVVSRTGAGDAFGSGIVASLAKGYDLEDAMRIGTLNSESVIQSFGAKQGILKKWPPASQLKEIKVRPYGTR